MHAHVPRCQGAVPEKTRQPLNLKVMSASSVATRRDAPLRDAVPAAGSLPGLRHPDKVACFALRSTVTWQELRLHQGRALPQGGASPKVNPPMSCSGPPALAASCSHPLLASGIWHQGLISYLGEGVLPNPPVVCSAQHCHVGTERSQPGGAHMQPHKGTHAHTRASTHT